LSGKTTLLSSGPVYERKFSQMSGTSKNMTEEIAENAPANYSTLFSLAM